MTRLRFQKKRNIETITLIRPTHFSRFAPLSTSRFDLVLVACAISVVSDDEISCLLSHDYLRSRAFARRGAKIYNSYDSECDTRVEVSSGEVKIARALSEG